MRDAICTDDPTTVIVTHGLGSCFGVTFYDPVTQVGGLFHVTLQAIEDYALPKEERAHPGGNTSPKRKVLQCQI